MNDEKPTQVRIIRSMIRILGLVFILWSPIALYIGTLGAAAGGVTPQLKIITLSILGLFITSFGVVTFMKWSWYSAIILLPIFIITDISLGGLNQILAISTFPIILFLFLLIPKVKEQFS